MIAINIPRTQYLSFSDTRRYSFEMPVGNPGDAGKPMGPAVGIIGAIGTIGAGLATPGIVGGLMIAGGIASGVGALTGNKFLSNLGMGLGLAGGIGSFFSMDGSSFFLPGGEGNPAFADTIGGKFVSDMAGGVKNLFTGQGGFTSGGNISTTDAIGKASELAPSGLDVEQIGRDSGLLRNLGDSGSMVDKMAPASGGGINLSATVPGAAGGAAKQGGSFLGNLWDSLGSAGKGQVISGGLQGLLSFDPSRQEAEQNQIEAASRLYEAKTQGELQDQRFKDQQYSNLQYQTVSAPTANSNYSPAEYSGPAGPRYVVQDPTSGNILNLTAEQYAAWKQQQGA